MKKSGIYQESEIIYDVKSPSVSLNDYKDKYIKLNIKVIINKDSIGIKYLINLFKYIT